VHRDVKASNVILGHDTQGPRPVLLDFGLVKLLDAEGPGLTSSRSMLGTPAAMAPEQMKGQPVTARTDVYAVALLAYHMLTGAPAFGGTPGVVQSYLQVHGPRPRPSAKVDIDPAIDEPIIRALAPDPTQRYSSPLELLEAFKAIIQPSSASDGEQEVVALYVEGGPAELAQASSIATSAGMTIAMAAPDSLIAVAPSLDLTSVRLRLEEREGGEGRARFEPGVDLCGGRRRAGARCRGLGAVPPRYRSLDHADAAVGEWRSKPSLRTSSAIAII
jgi:serine/threonine protein kinase